MDESPATDTELLTAWVTQRSEVAFRALVARYAGLVHMAARRTSDSDDLAAEVTQTVFILLARKAKGLMAHTSLGGWLHVTAVMQAKNLLRKHQLESRKRHQLHTTMDTEANEQARETWTEMQPVLDGALAALSDQDREAIVLRFYRSLSIREIATTLGIATSAAQKRVDRATDRLREKLARRGCQAGTPLALALVTGFATDTQACAVLVPALTTKAVAAAGATTALSSTLIPLALMKTSTDIPATVALALSAIWIASQHQSAAKLESGNEQLAARINQYTGRMTASTGSISQAEVMHLQAGAGKTPDGTANTVGGIDWHDFAVRINESLASGSNFKVREQRQKVNDAIYKRMTKEELLAVLRMVGEMDFPQETINELENIVCHPLTMRFPEYALNELSDRLAGSEEFFVQNNLLVAFEGWIDRDPAAAIAWMDAQVAAGKFEGRGLEGLDRMGGIFEGRVISSLLATDPTAAARRLEAVAPEHRGRISFGELPPQHHAAFADLVRKVLNEKDALKAIETQIFAVDSSTAEVTAFIEAIHATPEERALCVRTAARNLVANKLMNKLNPDFTGIREWAETTLPGSAAGATGYLLGEGLVLHELGIAEASRLVLEYAEAGDGDSVLVPFLESEVVQGYNETARNLAKKVSDPVIRKRLLIALH